MNSAGRKTTSYMPQLKGGMSKSMQQVWPQKNHPKGVKFPVSIPPTTGEGISYSSGFFAITKKQVLSVDTLSNTACLQSIHSVIAEDIYVKGWGTLLEIVLIWLIWKKYEKN